MDGDREGTPFGRYRLLEVLGRGGMGEVWRAFDTATKRTVAIKVLPAQVGHDDEFAQRFRREAEAAAGLNSPHVIPIHDYGEIDDRVFVSMRLVDGRDLASVLADGPLDPARAVRIIEQVAKALHAAHKVGLIHRDVKPSNILLDEDDFAYLIDFGIARATDETRLTKSGNTIGTFAYIAPERLHGQAEEDGRVDIYSLACVLYEALTGEQPFAGDTTPRLIAAHLHDPPPRPSITRPEVPAGVDDVIATGMAKDPDRRYATTVELATAAHDAITVPLQQPTAQPRVDPTRIRETQPAPHPVPAGPATVQAPRGATEAVAAPPSPSIPTKSGGISRRTTLTLVGGGAVIAIAAAIGIPALTKNESSVRPSSSRRSYGAQIELPFTELKDPCGVAVDTTGNLYVVDLGNKRVLELPVGSSSQQTLPFTGLRNPLRVAAHTPGKIYVADRIDNETAQVLGLATGPTRQEVLPFTGLKRNLGVAVDAAGNVYVTEVDDSDKGVDKRVLKLPAGARSQQLLPFDFTGFPNSVAVDVAGGVYVADQYQLNGFRVLKLPAGSTRQEVLPFTGFRNPNGVAVDGSGGVYVNDTETGKVLRLAAGSSSQEVLPFTGLNRPAALAVDTAGNVYVADTGNNRVLKLPVQ